MPLISGRADFTFTQRRKHYCLLTRPALRALLSQHMHRPESLTVQLPDRLA